ncbi:MAG TPA: amino acid adenylation domain-containing protein, partial [Phycisphaerae bacterium]|nr:amino acid adenylation domain-containing protein [Phycisphaerae bacterium]
GQMVLELGAAGLRAGDEKHAAEMGCEIWLQIQADGEGVRLAADYRADLFDRETIERFLACYGRLLEAAVANPDVPVTRLPLQGPAELRQLIEEWNQTAAAYPRERCLHELFEEQVARMPDATAVTFENQKLTYRALNERANQVAHHLRSLGVGPEVLVGLCVKRSVEMMVGLLGILKAGGAYVPLDPTYPKSRLAYMLGDSGAAVLLTQRELTGSLPEHKTRVVCMDADWEKIGAQGKENPARAAGPENLAYVIYTSGSTGRPKGAMILHRGLVNYLTWALKAYPVAEGRGAPVHSSISFDLTITGLLAPLLAGGTVLLVPEDLGVQGLVETLRQQGDFSLVKITPAHLELLSRQLSPEETAGRARAFIIGGENLTYQNVAYWQEHAPETLLVNEYGPTETVVGCCIYCVPAGERRAGSIPIGRPIANTQLYILDKHLQPVPIGVAGELCIAGDGVARGYLHAPELTARKFIANPFAKEAGARLYRTGDLARYLADGTIEFLGRMDDQVKIRGYRIELGEIESTLRLHPQVAQAHVINQEKRLVAYLVTKGPEPIRPADLRAFLSGH